jgi:hypothetical protein
MLKLFREAGMPRRTPPLPARRKIGWSRRWLPAFAQCDVCTAPIGASGRIVGRDVAAAFNAYSGSTAAPIGVHAVVTAHCRGGLPRPACTSFASSMTAAGQPSGMWTCSLPDKRPYFFSGINVTLSRLVELRYVFAAFWMVAASSFL